jgi:hypothetical protein
VTGHPNPNIEDGTKVLTSLVLEHDEESGLVETRNTVYRLVDND